MTIHELIELLKPYDGDADVAMRQWDPDNQRHKSVEIFGIQVLLAKDGTPAGIDLIDDEDD